MPLNTVWFIDTSVFVEILDVPGKAQQPTTVADEFVKRSHAGHKFILPVTTIIETGNHVAQCTGDRREAARRFVEAVRQASESEPPWIIRDVQWNSAFISDLMSGDSTGSSLVDLLGDGRMGTGDVSILVEREKFTRSSTYTDVRLWTLEKELGSYS